MAGEFEKLFDARGQGHGTGGSIKIRIHGLDLEFFHDFISRVFSHRTTIDRHQDTGAELNDFSSRF
jgi:hypothetical protein